VAWSSNVSLSLGIFQKDIDVYAFRRKLVFQKAEKWIYRGASVFQREAEISTPKTYTEPGQLIYDD
jgi:hypothetical protein